MLAQVLVMAFVMVAATALLLIPVMLQGLGLAARGWRPVDVALFGSILASTDAVAVSAVLHAGGAPEALSVVLEGESLFNDATSITLFEVFREAAKSSTAEDLPLGQAVSFFLFFHFSRDPNTHTERKHNYTSNQKQNKTKT